MTMERLSASAALLLIDIQQGMDDPGLPRRNNPGAERNIARLLAAWRAAGRPVVHVRHHSTEPNSPLRPEKAGVAFKPEAAPIEGEPIFTKGANSAFIGTDLEVRLRARGIETLAVIGVQTNACVEATTRNASDLGFQTYVVSDATWTYDKTGPDGRIHTAETLHEATLVNLHREFATIVTSDEVLGAL